MPWNKRSYPDSMKNLPEAVRNKAVEIANALLEERNMNEGIVIATAISRAKDWAANRGKKIVSEASASTDVKHHGKDRYVIPDEGGWAVKTEDGNRKHHYDTKQEAVSHARAWAKKDYATLTVQRKDGKVQSRTSYNPNKRAPRQTSGAR